MNEAEKNLNKFTKDLDKSLKTMMPQMHQAIAKIQSATANMQPRMMKECTIDNHKAKVTLYVDNAIRIEFTDATAGEKLYNSWQ
jgi:hypothetical protein